MNFLSLLFPLSSRFFSKFSFVLKLNDFCHAVFYHFSPHILPFRRAYSSVKIHVWKEQFARWRFWRILFHRCNHHQHQGCSCSKAIKDRSSSLIWEDSPQSLLKTDVKRLTSLNEDIKCSMPQQWQHSVNYKTCYSINKSW